MRGFIAAVILRTLILADLSDMLITNIVCVRNSQYGVSGKQRVLNIWMPEGSTDIKYNGPVCLRTTKIDGDFLYATRQVISAVNLPPRSHPSHFARCTTSSNRRKMATQDPKEESL